jgi:CBS domain-containing protein
MTTGSKAFGLIGERFERALNNNDKLEVVEEARRALLERDPLGSVLLSSVTASSSDSVMTAMRLMRKHGLNQILVTEAKVPAEFGILSASDLARFLLADNPDTKDAAAK